MATSTMQARAATCAAAAARLSMTASTAVRGVAPVGSLTRRLPRVGRGASSISVAFPSTRVRHRHGMTVVPRAGWNDFTWGKGSVVSNTPAAEEGGLHSVMLSVDAETAKGYTTPGMFVQMRTSEEGKPAFIAIASAPEEGSSTFELLIKSTEGTAGEICALAAGSEVGVSPVMGKGFDLSKAPEDETPVTLLFATGSGISPIRALIASGQLEGREVTLYYGGDRLDASSRNSRASAPLHRPDPCSQSDERRGRTRGDGTR